MKYWNEYIERFDQSELCHDNMGNAASLTLTGCVCLIISQSSISSICSVFRPDAKSVVPCAKDTRRNGKTANRTRSGLCSVQCSSCTSISCHVGSALSGPSRNLLGSASGVCNSSRRSLKASATVEANQAEYDALAHGDPNLPSRSRENSDCQYLQCICLWPT
jgi:hypothetical protein